MMLLDILFTLFLTHVGSLTNVENNQRRFAPTPAHIERNYLPTSPEYAGPPRSGCPSAMAGYTKNLCAGALFGGHEVCAADSTDLAMKST